MQAQENMEISLVDLYLNASCFNKISDTTFQNMLSYESEADPIERKLIKRIKEQVRHGKVVLSSGSKEKA
jgi:hypothetical protein